VEERSPIRDLRQGRRRREVRDHERAGPSEVGRIFATLRMRSFETSTRARRKPDCAPNQRLGCFCNSGWAAAPEYSLPRLPSPDVMGLGRRRPVRAALLTVPCVWFASAFAGLVREVAYRAPDMPGGANGFGAGDVPKKQATASGLST